ncbi:hypothetical protein ACNOYE_27930 [Nannocystaceae bacterium ST9]
MTDPLYRIVEGCEPEDLFGTRYLVHAEQILAIETCVLVFAAHLVVRGSPPWLVPDTFVGKRVRTLCRTRDSVSDEVLREIEGNRWPEPALFDPLLLELSREHANRAGRQCVEPCAQADRRILEVLVSGGVTALFVVTMLATFYTMLAAGRRPHGIRQGFRLDVALPLLRLLERAPLQCKQPGNRAPVCHSRARVILGPEWGRVAADCRSMDLDMRLRRLAESSLR